MRFLRLTDSTGKAKWFSTLTGAAHYASETGASIDVVELNANQIATVLNGGVIERQTPLFDKLEQKEAAGEQETEEA